MWRSFFTDRKWMFWCYGGGSLILVLIVFQTWLSVQFNTWYGSFYDLLQKPPETGGLEQFYERLTYFLYLAIPYVTTISLQIGLQGCGLSDGVNLSLFHICHIGVMLT